MMRLFAALVPPVDALEHLDAFLDVRRAAAGFRWSAADQVHVTLGFYEQVPDHALDDLVARLAAAAARRTSFPARIAGGGAFPDVARARVLWAGLDLAEPAGTELGRLAEGARAAAVAAGVRVDGARFRPHLTLARLGRPEEMTAWVRLLDTYEGPTWSAEAVTLVESHLGEGPRGRPRYVEVEAFPLADPGVAAPERPARA